MSQPASYSRLRRIAAMKGETMPSFDNPQDVGPILNDDQPEQERDWADEKAIEVVSRLDAFAREVDNYEYGLPVYSDEAAPQLVEIVAAALRKAEQRGERRGYERGVEDSAVYAASRFSADGWNGHIKNAGAIIANGIRALTTQQEQPAAPPPPKEQR